jgi:CubicO group peptidase (beta-lactamase class C family)
MNLRAALHKNPGFIPTAIVTLAGVSMIDVAQTRVPDTPAPHLKESELISAARQELGQEAASGRFAGAALIAHNGKPVFAQAYGLADREHKIPNTLKTRFRIGSMNKVFTAVATLQLVQQDKLGLDDPMGKYLTDYPNKDLTTKVTIHQLLTHTGGTGDIFGPEYDAHRLELHNLQDYLKLYGNRGPSFEPGSRWEYSNYGFILLGAIVEKVSGESYYDYVREHIYKPAGMTSTGSEPEDQAVPDRSIGYTASGAMNGSRPNTGMLPYRGTSAGGGYSTVGDLLRFANAVQQYELLNAHYTEILTVGKVKTPGGLIASAFADYEINGIRCFGHGGGSIGMNADLEVCPGPGYVVVVLANMDPPSASQISLFLSNRLPEK